MTAKKTVTNKTKPKKRPSAATVSEPEVQPATITAKLPHIPKKTSALAAAAQVLAAAKEPLSSQQLIEAMAGQGLWTSPGGKTPHATLFSALMREINTKGPESRFKKAERGKFSLA